MDTLSEKWVYSFYLILRELSLKKFKGHWAKLCHPFAVPLPPSKAKSNTPSLEYQDFSHPVP